MFFAIKLHNLLLVKYVQFFFSFWIMKLLKNPKINVEFYLVL
jgi:hypothetical protein